MSEESDAVAEAQAIEAARVPEIISARQIRLALHNSGILLADIETALASLPEPTKSEAQIEWEYSVEFRRDHPLVNQVASILGWTTEQKDALWTAAFGL